MSGPKEYWANVYVDDGIADLGSDYDNPTDCSELAHGLSASRFRIHVRPKPEGAPKRYLNSFDQMMWECGHTRGLLAGEQGGGV